MKSLLVGTCLLFLCGLAVFAQDQSTAVPSGICSPENPEIPEWARMLYSANPNAWEVREAYEEYYSSHPFVKTMHTQNYKQWVSRIQNKVGADGEISEPSAPEKGHTQEDILQQRGGGDLWQFAGPDIHYSADGQMIPMSEHANVYCNDRSMTDANLLYCGTESGGLYKTTDQGAHWSFVTPGLLVGSVSAVRIHPTNPEIVIFSAENDLYRTTNGGTDWEIIGQPDFVSLDISAWEIAFNPEDPTLVYVAANQGFFRSQDGGDTWEEILFNESQCVQFQPGNPAVIYTLQNIPNTDEFKFYKSTNYGASFTMYDEGWFAELPGYENIDVFGGRIAVSEADPNRIYALLVGYGQYDADSYTNGWIGTWVSYDAGLTWSFPHDQIGTPYTADHQNLMNFVGDDGDYSQILYNTTMIASQLDADQVLIGGLNLWRSNDACASYEGVGGYIGGMPYFHVDQQELKIYKTGDNSQEVWCSNDGGICYSTDFMQTIENRCRGIEAVNLWGYDQGWNEDIMVGGRYHNGNMAHHENYPEGEFLALGGGEAATGYVNYSDENETFFSDIGGRILPETIDGQPGAISLSLGPNESYWFNNSSRILFDHQYFNVAWLGRDHILYRSVDGGSTYSAYHAFGTNTDNKIYWLEQSYADPNYIYVHQRIGNVSKLWMTSDGGSNWSEVPLPYTLSNLFFDIGSTNPQEIWVGYTYGGNGNKIFHTTNAGGNWENITSAQLNGREIWGVAHQYGTDGGVYLALLNGSVMYRNASMSDWVNYSDGLPVSTQPIRIVPFYKGGKLRLATWNLGVWEAPLYEESSLLADFAAEYGTFFCPGDPVHFTDHSVCSAEATYAWSFPGAIPSSSTEKNPTVEYSGSGQFDVTLVVTDNGDTQSVSKLAYIESQTAVEPLFSEDFESGGFPLDWKSEHSTGGSGNWNVTGDASAYGTGVYSMRFDNYWFDAQGNRDEIWLGKLETEYVYVGFDYAYAQYDNNYSDSLAVLYSYDCGLNWTEIWMKGGDDLATSPDNGNPFTPISSEWMHADLMIDPEIGSELIIAFQNRGHWGNNIYVDNILVDHSDGIETPDPLATMSIQPNPIENEFVVSFESPDHETLNVLAMDGNGKLIFRKQVMKNESGIRITVNSETWASGIYTIALLGEQTRAWRKVIKK